MRSVFFACALVFLLLGASGCSLSQKSEAPPINDNADLPTDVIPQKDKSVEKDKSTFFSYEECVKNGGGTEGSFPARKCTLNGFISFENDAEKVFPQEYLSCESDADCVPFPECHPHSCLNSEFVDQYGEQPEMCTALFDGSAAYSAEDCLCVNGYCANKNASGNDLAAPPISSDCPTEEALVCGQTAYCECSNGSAVSMTPIDVDKSCMRGCEKVIQQQTYLNECVMKEAGAVLVAELECLQMDATSDKADDGVFDEPQSDAQISSFEECAAAGYPVMKSHPRKCRAPDGELFVEEIIE